MHPQKVFTAFSLEITPFVIYNSRFARGFSAQSKTQERMLPDRRIHTKGIADQADSSIAYFCKRCNYC
ncbi:MAG: hypothetical protein DRP83_09550 [Planctomycetota bacterium]|nr:MAG: hypothetical protein DRP83_09550 [Planctomycetota bacterium]